MTESVMDFSPPLNCDCPPPGRDRFGDPLCVPADTHKCGRRHRIKEVQADKVESRNSVYDPKFMSRLTVFSKNRQIDPRKAVMVSRTPDYVRHVENAAIFQQRQPISNTRHSRTTHDSGVVQVVGFN